MARYMSIWTCQSVQLGKPQVKKTNILTIICLMLLNQETWLTVDDSDLLWDTLIEMSILVVLKYNFIVSLMLENPLLKPLTSRVYVDLSTQFTFNMVIYTFLLLHPGLPDLRMQVSTHRNTVLNSVFYKHFFKRWRQL